MQLRLAARFGSMPVARATVRALQGTMRTGWLMPAALVLCALGINSCASPPPVPPCHTGLRERPAITQQCREQYDSRRYIANTAKLIGERLIGRRAYLGSLDLSIGFGEQGTIESVCRRRFSGAKVYERSGDAMAELYSQPSAPFCFAGRRIEITWESPVVTEAEIDVAVRSCGDAATVPGRGLAMCFSVQHCDDDDYEQLFGEANHLFVGCVLQKLPLTFIVPGSDEILNFMPKQGSTPTSALALDALKTCRNPDATREELIGCVDERGWEPSQWAGIPTRDIGTGPWLRDD